MENLWEIDVIKMEALFIRLHWVYSNLIFLRGLIKLDYV
jgi:hypothetical protein